MAEPTSYFALFGLPETFAIDVPRLEQARLTVQAQVHPDRFAGASERDKRLAMQWAAQANAAYLTLKHPVRRAAYLCGLRGAAVDAERNTAMPAEFLQQQMQWRETLDDIRAQGDQAALQTLRAQVQEQRQSRLAAVEQALDVDHAPERAAQEVRALLFLDRFIEELDRAQDALMSR